MIEPAENESPFISDVIDLSRLKIDEFNIIPSGTGTGKSYFMENHLPKFVKDNYGIQPSELLFVTSRSLIVDQQTSGKRSMAGENLISKFDGRDVKIIRRWNKEMTMDMFPPDKIPTQQEFINLSLDEFISLGDAEIKTMTLDKLIHVLIYCNNPNFKTLSGIKMVVLDECHALFSDKFIRNIEVLKVWIRDSLYEGTRYFIGMTATAEIIKRNYLSWGVRLNYLLDEPLIRYKAKKLYVTRFNALAALLTTRFSVGKTLIMCKTINDCKKLRAAIPNSAILVSKSTKKHFTKEMDFVRSFIAFNETLPEYVSEKHSDTGIGFKLNTLITTSTMREGINLREESGIRNVVCCIPDELHITQFLGRCRFDVDNLIVGFENDSISPLCDMYLAQCTKDFANYIYDKQDMTWFNSIKHITSAPAPARLFLDETSFIDYLRKTWISTERLIIFDKDRDEILNFAISSRIIEGIKPSQITFTRVIKYIENEIGYTVESGRKRINGKLYTYKKIIRKKKKEKEAVINSD